MNLHDYITVSRDIQFGKAVFKGTRVPVQSLFFHLEGGVTIDDFLKDFPSVSKKQVEAVLESAARLFEFSKWEKIDESITG